MMTLKERYKAAAKIEFNDAINPYYIIGALITGCLIMPFSLTWGLLAMAMPTIFMGLSLTKYGISALLPKAKKPASP